MTALVSLTADIVAAFLETNKLAANEIPQLIRNVHGTLADVGKPAPAEEPKPTITPAQVRKSIRDDTLVSFLDGKPYRTLKRHLATHGMTPDEYRSRFGLPKDYPLTAPGYSRLRSEHAKAAGLGSTGRRAKKPVRKG